MEGKGPAQWAIAATPEVTPRQKAPSPNTASTTRRPQAPHQTVLL